jgi:hypothetical protein
MPEDYALSLEEIKRMMANAGGTNLAGQSMAGPVATGQSYAQSIAGGMPMSQVIAPGVSYSPEQPSGYTQADLDFLARGPAPVMPIAPTTGVVATIDDQMPYAPPGVTQPTPFFPGSPFIPGQTPFPGIGNLDFLKDLDFSNLPDFSNIDFSNIDFSNIDVDAILKDYQDGQNIGEPEPITSFFEAPAPVMPSAPVSSGLFDITPELITKQIEKQKIEGIEPVYDRVAEEQIIPSFVPQSVINQVPVMPEMPIYQEPIYQEPIYQEPINIPQITNLPIQQPMNFTGLPQVQEPVYQKPIKNQFIKNQFIKNQFIKNQFIKYQTFQFSNQ